MEFDVEGVGGGIGEGDIPCEADDDGVVIDSGSIFLNLASQNGAQTISIDPDGDFDFIDVALDPEDFDSNDKKRINRIATVEEVANEDIVLGFRLNSDDDDEDHSPTDPGYEELFHRRGEQRRRDRPGNRHHPGRMLSPTGGGPRAAARLSCRPKPITCGPWPGAPRRFGRGPSLLPDGPGQHVGDRLGDIAGEGAIACMDHDFGGHASQQLHLL